jgi:hypothetical protein
MIRPWRKERRWTTAHNVTKETFDLDDEKAAKLLAWIVFIGLEVLPYEMEQRQKNGDID